MSHSQAHLLILQARQLAEVEAALVAQQQALASARCCLTMAACTSASYCCSCCTSCWAWACRISSRSQGKQEAIQ